MELAELLHDGRIVAWAIPATGQSLEIIAVRESTLEPISWRTVASPARQKNHLRVAQVEEVQEELEWMQCFLSDADARRHKEALIPKIKELAYDAQDVIDKFMLRVFNK
ncbi:hypothetical protein Dimus_008763 [Dionaea muscipula]